MTARRLAATGFFATLCFAAIFSIAHAQTACRGFQSKDKITEFTLSPGVWSETFSEPATVRWEFPSGVCLYRWLIELKPIGQGSRNLETVYIRVAGDSRAADIPPDGLVPGMEYRVKVLMEYAKDRYGPEASTDTEVFTTCKENGTPGAPSRLSLKPQSWQGYTLAGGSVELCWSPIRESGYGCASEYTVAVREQPSNPSDLFDDAHAWRFEKFPTAGCHRLYGMEPGKTYDIGVRAYNEANRTSSAVSLIQEYASDRWECVEGDFYADGSDHTMYDWCAAAKSGQCTPMTCAEIANAGMCGHPSVRKFDPEHFTVIQYCSYQCNCNVPSSEEIGQVPYRKPDSNEWACCT